MKDKIKIWFEKMKIWFKKNWFMIFNYIVIILVYAIFFGREDVVFAELSLGGWLLFSLGYSIYKWFEKNKIK